MQGDGDTHPSATTTTTTTTNNNNNMNNMNNNSDMDEDPETDESSGKLVIDLEDQDEAPPPKRTRSDFDSNSEMRMRIKRKKMATRNSGPQHEVLPPSTSISSSNYPVVTNGECNATMDLPNGHLATHSSEQDGGIAQERLEQRDVGTSVRSVSSSTDPNLLGACEPGSEVCLEGCIFHEDLSGFLVVNVTWRGKSYVGTLLDCSRHEWGPPRPCEVNGGDGENNGGGKGGLKGGRLVGKRGGRLPHSASTSELGQTTQGGRSIRQSSSINRLKSRTPAPPPTTDDEESNGGVSSEGQILEPLSPTLTCPCRHCHKKFTTPVGLKFHQDDEHRPPPLPTPPSLPPEPAPPPSTSNVDVVDTEEDKADLKLTPVESESLQQLFAGYIKVATPSPPPPPPTDATTADIPQLEPTDQRASSRSPAAYSDISDDGAPVLTKEIDSNNSHKKRVSENGRSNSASTTPLKSGDSRKVFPKKIEVSTPKTEYATATHTPTAKLTPVVDQTNKQTLESEPTKTLSAKNYQPLQEQQRIPPPGLPQPNSLPQPNFAFPPSGFFPAALVASPHPMPLPQMAIMRSSPLIPNRSPAPLPPSPSSLKTQQPRPSSCHSDKSPAATLMLTNKGNEHSIQRSLPFPYVSSPMDQRSLYFGGMVQSSPMLHRK